MENPLGLLKMECLELVKGSLRRIYPEVQLFDVKFSQPPNPEMGELSSSVSFQLASKIRANPVDIASRIVEESTIPSDGLVSRVEALNGYINFYVNIGSFFRLVLETAAENKDYGFLKTKTSEKIIVEHTSANPIRPLHIGTARNSILGDTLARMLKRRGHAVEVHFYVDDMGRQVAMATYGWRLLNKPEPPSEPEKWFGDIYASVNILKEVRRLKRELEEASDTGDYVRVREINAELSKYAKAAQELTERNKEVFNAIAEAMENDPDPDASIQKLNMEYERQEPTAKKDVRTLANHCVHGFERILKKLDIKFDRWDYEGDLVWSGAVDEAMDALRKTPYTFYEEGALVLDCEAVAKDMGLKEKWGINPSYEIPRLVLIRSDGTTLYTPRDIAYSLKKFERVDRVINVIGNEQSLAQLQLKIALAAMGKIDLADRQTHFAYEFVRLPDVKMSGRLGRYVTLEEVMDKSILLAYEEVSKRTPELTEEKKKEIAKIVGYGALKFTLLNIDPIKVVIFDWNRALNFEINSAPFIQYSYARACNILKRAEKMPEPDYNLLASGSERSLVMMIAQFPEIFENASESLKPSDISTFTNILADKFNSFYASQPVIKAEPSSLAGARLMLVKAIKVVLKNSLEILGIEAPERM
ncbi:arginine--tRNA ligase [Candidatus Bathyarchaeota archaeon]|nr:arginine--tRNA ligase [Candidatus Bathyarchaeota archaeon]MBS7630383.1 arginine--tRNA ligase [Candidatus Bathyarchaeota archaeon]